MQKLASGFAWDFWGKVGNGPTRNDKILMAIRIRDPNRYADKTCLGGGIHCSSASGCSYVSIRAALFYSFISPYRQRQNTVWIFVESVYLLATSVLCSSRWTLFQSSSSIFFFHLFWKRTFADEWHRQGSEWKIERGGTVQFTISASAGSRGPLAVKVDPALQTCKTCRIPFQLSVTYHLIVCMIQKIKTVQFRWKLKCCCICKIKTHLSTSSSLWR